MLKYLALLLIVSCGAPKDSTRLIANEVLGKKPSKIERVKDDLTIAGEAAAKKKLEELGR
jgi:hypothetical protein